MALILADRVKESTTTTGTSDFALGGAITGFQTFSASVGANNTTYYSVADGADWEVGLGTLSNDGLTLARTTVLQSSNADAKVSFAAGSKEVFVTYAADKAVYEDASGNVTVPAIFTATTKVVSPFFDAVGSAGGQLRNASGTSQLAWGAGGGSNLSLEVSTNLNGTNAQIDISPTGTGHVHIKPSGSGSLEISPTSAGTMNNIAIGGTTPRAGAFTTVTATTPIAAASGGTGLSSLGTGVATFLGTPSSANLAAAVTDETGTGSLVFANTPTLVTPILGTPTSATLTNATGLPIASGVSGLGTGVATFLATPSGANLIAALTDETGTGSAVFATSPTLVTPVLGTPTSATLTNATGLPLTTGVTGILPTANGGTNLTSFTSGGVVYASSSSALATGSALTFDGTDFSNTSGKVIAGGDLRATVSGSGNVGLNIARTGGTTADWYNYIPSGSADLAWFKGGEIMRLTSTLLYTASGISLSVGSNSTFGKFYAYESAQIQTFQGAYGSSGNFQTGTGTVTLGGSGGGVNPRGIGVLINANRSAGSNTTLPYGNDYETFGLISVANVGTGGGYGTTGVAGYAESDGGVYGLRADAKTTSAGSIAVGLYVGSVTGSSTNYGVYVNDASASNYFGGNVGIGTTSNTYKFEVRSLVNANTATTQANFLDAGTTGGLLYQHRINVQGKAGTGNINMGMTDNSSSHFNSQNCVFIAADTQPFMIWQSSAQPIIFATNGSEKMRLDSAGYFVVGSATATTALLGSNSSLNVPLIAAFSSAASGYTDALILSEFRAYAPNNGTARFSYFGDTVAARAVIYSNGGLANYSANNVNLSDRREKTNFAPATSYLDKICAIPVQTFNYIDQNMEDDGGLTLGVVAQDVQAVAPELVMESNWGTKEDPKMRLSIYQTDLQYALMKCIQEQQAIIESLKARLDAANL
jgi:hypothetical protein